MKFYVVTAGYDYEGDDVMGVHSTMELAKYCVYEMKANPEFHFDNYQIEEHEVDE